ncbi:hypothetical protein SAMN02982919_00449 [Giesbergeria anulus]|uniref:Uncharacterized protein n=2 Tax=Giesbergeria anulus TaxID=180197 RepID=A0A1H9F3U6_9BURK|nr:hypothetical protein SAMN02982919_00449 [Giesbergeria anulus]
MHTKQNAPHHPKAMESAALSKLHSATTMRAVNRLALAACTTVQARATVRHGAEHTKVEQIAVSVQGPHDSGALPCLVFMRSRIFRGAMVLGWVSRIREVRGVTNCTCSTTQPTRYSLNTGPSGLPSQLGAETMTTSPVASRCAAPIHTPTTGTTPTEAQAFALLEAINASALAGLYIRRGNLPAARRKAVQLLKALQVMEVAA